MRVEEFSRALDACYDAVSAPERWKSALHELAFSLDATCAMFYPKDVADGATQVPSSTLYADLLEEYVAGQWYENHYRAERGWPIMELNPVDVILEHDLSTEEERRRLATYNEFYLKWGYPGFAAIPFHVEKQKWCLPLLRSVKQGHFSREEARTLALLSPDLRRMMHLNEQFARARASSGLDALDNIGRAAILLDWRARVVQMSTGAESLLARAHDSIVLRDGRLYARHSPSNDALQALLGSIGMNGYRRQRAIEARPVRIDRPAGRAMVAELVSLRDIVTIVSASAFGILLISDPDDLPRPDEDRLRVALSLTPAEAKLSALMAQGLGIDQAADRLGVTTGTARERVKAIFAKTDTHRQGELVALLSRILR